MASLGSLGKQRAAVEIDFDWFGETIRVNPRASNLTQIEFMDLAANIQTAVGDTDVLTLTQADLERMDPEKRAAVSQVLVGAERATVGSLRKLIHVEDWDRFWTLAVENGQHLQDLMEVQQQIVEAVTEQATGFPTGQPSASSDGQTAPPTVPNSTAASLSPVPLTDADKALAMWRQRPDLQEFIVDKEDAERKALSSPS